VNSVANGVQPTVPVLAPMAVIDPVAIANIESLLAAIASDRELYERRKHLWEGTA